MRRSSIIAGSSGRQSITALRVQDSNRMGLLGLQTPQMKDRGVSGKLSMSKPTPGTAERKVSSVGHRASGAGGSRSSQFGVFGTEKMKDPRPLHDKAFVQQCIKRLSEFLAENGYAHSVSIKSLQSPSVKDFLKIFTFIYGFLCPSYELPGSKFEEEIPRLFKELGYPFALSKSSMYTVGAPHTWPQMVAALLWLIDCVKLFSAMRENAAAFDDDQSWGGETEDGIVHNKLFMDYAVKCYELFMKGADTFEEQDAELEAKLKELFKVDESRTEELVAENRRLSEELARLEKEKESEPDRRVALRKLKASLEQDVQKFQAYLANMESHVALLEQKLEAVTEEVEAAELEAEAVRQENARLQHLLDSQKYSVADIERIHREKNELQQTISKLSKELEAEEQQLWNEEMKYARSREAGPLMDIMNQTEEDIRDATQRKMALEEALEQLNAMVVEKNNSVKVLKEEAEKLDELYHQKLKEAEEEEQKWAEELELLEKHKRLLEGGVNEGLDEATKELQDLQRQYQVLLQTRTEESRRTGDKLDHLLEVVATHVVSIEKYLDEQSTQTDRAYEELMAEDLLSPLTMILDSYKKKAEGLSAAGGLS
ncbi:kinetochore protein NDC80 homolog isoform X2 [Pogoniulus pusillus]|uniref:kinetochore protein NDC80 homolog isoform X2 n=1 Tax=Pogoniulus pusillus TaxID=488313 RepID=UPI0030B97240